MDDGNVEHDALQDTFHGKINPTDVKFSTLERITRNFSKDQIIGEGGFGTVYKGVLRDGEVAVKTIKSDKTINEKLFQREVTILLNISHRNIVRFLGFCSHTIHKAVRYEGQYVYAENRDRLLCFEYINNGNLKKYITDELRGLEWDIRFSIIKGICEGLLYLHQEVGIIHRDLKPENILIDSNMVAKITDFGLSRVEKNAHTESDPVSTPGYTAPEYIDNGEMSLKYDIYSLGVIIIELVTGSKSIPESNKVLRRWRHRLYKLLGKQTQYMYKQIAKLIEIGLLCQEKDPCNRPSISDIIHVITELESTNMKINNTDESTAGQISPYMEDDMLGIEPLELHFPFDLNNHISRSLELTNETNAFIAFSIQTTSSLPYCIQPNKDIVAPRSKYNVNITLQPLEKAPTHNCTHDFIVRSTKVKESLTSKDVTADIFNEEEGILVDKVKIVITYKAMEPQVDVSPTEAVSKLSASTSDEVIQFDPPELRFPKMSDKTVLSSIKIVNVTESFVSFVLCYVQENNAAEYAWSKVESVLPPRHTECLTVTREGTENAVNEKLLNDEILVYYAIVPEDIKACDLDLDDYNEHKKLPIVLTEVNSCTSNELIQFDPPELSFPCLNKTSLSSVNIVNNTDCYIGFNVWFLKENDAFYEREPCRGILPPHSNQRVVIRRTPNEKEPEEMQFKDKLFVWNMVVAEGVQASDLRGYTSAKDSKELPLIFTKIIPCSSDELIRLDHPGLRFTFLQTSLCSVNMVNVTDYFVGFRLLSGYYRDMMYYQANPKLGILAPGSSQRLVVSRVKKEKEPEDTQYNSGWPFMWNAIVSEGFKASDLDCYFTYTTSQTKKFPIILDKVTSSTSVDLIKCDPPEIRFPFLRGKSQLSIFKIVNVTEYHIAFNTCAEETNVASYITEPPCGILRPRTPQELVVKRVAKEEAPELEDKHCKDKYFVWSCFVTEDVNDSDIEEWMPITERKELPIVFTETSSDLIQFDPPELCFPLLPNQSVLSSTKIVNNTDQPIGFRICTKKIYSAIYYPNSLEGVLPPRSRQVLLVTRIGEEKELEDTRCRDKFLVWNGIVSEDVKANHDIDNLPDKKCTELPIVLTKTTSFTSDKLIQCDPLELRFPLLPKKKVSTSIKIVNLTDYNVGFNTYSRPTNMAWYHTEPPRGILPPRYTQKLMVTREEKEDASKDTQFNDKYFVWNSIVSEGVKDNDLTDYLSDQESKELPIFLDKITSSISDELIQLDPAELCVPLLLNKNILFRVNVVNITDCYVAFNAYWIERDAAWYKRSVGEGILPPRVTKKFTFGWETTEKELEDMEAEGDYFVWNRVVTERVERGDIIGYMAQEESKKLPLILKKASPCTSDDLIQFDPPELSLPLIPNKPLVFSVNIVNTTDYHVGFNVYNLKSNVSSYFIYPAGGVMPPRFTQRLAVIRLLTKNVQEYMQCQDKFNVQSGLVSEHVEASDFVNRLSYDGIKELPIAYKTFRISGDMIQLDPPQLTFPFLPNKRVPMLRLFKIFNATDQTVGFSIWSHENNSASYRIEPRAGILPAQSRQTVKVSRTLKENELEDIQCKDKLFVWNGIVTEGVEVSDVRKYWRNNDKELPVVLTKHGESTSR